MGLNEQKRGNLKILKVINRIYQIVPDDLTENDRELLNLQQDKLNAFYMEKAVRTFVRSRCKWGGGAHIFTLLPDPDFHNTTEHNFIFNMMKSSSPASGLY